MTDKDINELWELCGFKLDDYGLWLDPNGEISPTFPIAQLPELTLDNLFKYAVPVVPKDKIKSLLSYWAEFYALGEKRAEWLAKAILKVLRNKNTG